MELGYLQMRGREIIFSGSKSELLNMPEEFWKEIVGVKERIGSMTFYRNYTSKNTECIDPRNSGKSALEKEPGEYYIIIREEVDKK